MDEELLSEFLVESNENMASIEQQLMDLEASPDDASLLDSIFRTVHTVKGSCGFIGLKNLESVAHAGENVLGKMRAKKYAATAEIISMLLECADAIQVILDALQASNQEPEVDNSALIRRLHAAERLIDLGGDSTADSAVSKVQEEASDAAEMPADVAADEQQQDVAWLEDFADIRELLLGADLTTPEKVLEVGFNGIKDIGVAPAVALKLLGAAKVLKPPIKTMCKRLPIFQRCRKNRIFRLLRVFRLSKNRRQSLPSLLTTATPLKARAAQHRRRGRRKPFVWRFRCLIR